MAEILIVEDETAINELLRRNLELVGHRCRSVYDGEAAVKVLEEQAFDLMLLDIMLPGLDGFEVYREAGEIPTIFLTAKGGLTDRVKGLRMGADDYMVKPFEMLELLARVEAVLRRTHKGGKDFTFYGVRIDFESRVIEKDGQAVDCTPREYELLETMVKNRNIALSRERLLELVWGYDYEGDTRTVDVHIQKLRKKLGLEEYIKTVYKLGYRLEIMK